MNRPKRTGVFGCPGKGKVDQVVEVVSEKSGTLNSGVKTHFSNSSHTVDWFHVVQLFTKALYEVRRAETKEAKLSKATRWATSKRDDSLLTEKQIDALAELMSMELHTSKGLRNKEMLRWVRQAATVRGTKWQLTTLLNVARSLTGDIDLLKPICKALRTVEKPREVLRRLDLGAQQRSNRSDQQHLPGGRTDTEFAQIHLIRRRAVISCYARNDRTNAFLFLQNRHTWIAYAQPNMPASYSDANFSRVAV